jgi:hypothetical protein
MPRAARGPPTSDSLKPMCRHTPPTEGWTTEDDETRLLAISTRLAAVLTMAKTDPADGEYPPEAFVFGERVGTIKKAWETTVLKAHGVKPVRRRAWQTRRNGGGIEQRLPGHDNGEESQKEQLH